MTPTLFHALLTELIDENPFAIRAALRGQVIVSPGFWNRVNAVLGRHLPRRFMARRVARAQRRIRGGQPASA